MSADKFIGKGSSAFKKFDKVFEQGSVIKETDRNIDKLFEKKEPEEKPLEPKKTAPKPKTIVTPVKKYSKGLQEIIDLNVEFKSNNIGSIRVAKELVLELNKVAAMLNMKIGNLSINVLKDFLNRYKTEVFEKNV